MRGSRPDLATAQAASTTTATETASSSSFLTVSAGAAAYLQQLPAGALAAVAVAGSTTIMGGLAPRARLAAAWRPTCGR